MTIFTREVHVHLFQGRGYIPHRVQPEINFASYINESVDGNYSVVAFEGRMQKPSFYYTFKSREKLEQYVTEAIKRGLACKKAVEQDRAERVNFQHSLVVGDILVSMWGYDQTNVDFYEVTRLVGKKSVEIRRIGGEVTKTQWEGGSVVPAPGYFLLKKESMIKRVGEGNRLRLNTYSSASPVEYTITDGKKVYKEYEYTTYA